MEPRVPAAVPMPPADLDRRTFLRASSALLLAALAPEAAGQQLEDTRKALSVDCVASVRC